VLDSALKDEDVQAALLHVNEHQKEMKEMLVVLAGTYGTEAPERARAGLVARRMRDMGLKDVSLQTGSTPNVAGRIKGRSRGAVLFVSTMNAAPAIAQAQDGSAAHGPRAESERTTGPGTRGLAPTVAMLAAAAAIRDAGLEPTRDLIFAALPSDDVGLDAMKRLYAAYGDSVVAVVDVQGDGESIGYASGDELPGMAESSLVGTATAIVQWLGMEPELSNSSSASVRVATASATPAIVLGGASGGASGTLDEWADVTTMVRSAKHVVLLAATLR
jgi:acetylornithine deacetylase/succinyl-diaminopimelate desuccinylase-like protein